MRYQRLLVLFALLATGARAQWLNYPTPGTPRTKDGKPNLSAKTPRLAGKPDLGERVGALAMSLLPGLGAIYGDHLRTATPVSEAPIMEVLAHAHRVLHAEIRDGRALVEGDRHDQTIRG